METGGVVRSPKCLLTEQEDLSGILSTRVKKLFTAGSMCLESQHSMGRWKQVDPRRSLASQSLGSE